MHTLTVITGPEAGKSLQLGDDAIIIGREDADLVIPDPQLSRRHAAISASGAGVVIQDLGSANGVFVDGRRISEPTRLDAGAAVRLGASELVIDPRAEDVGPATAVPAEPKRSARRGPRSRRRPLPVLVLAILVSAAAAATAIVLLTGSSGTEKRTLTAQLTALPLAEPTSVQASGILVGEPLGRAEVIFQRLLEETPEPGGESVPLLGTMLVLSSSGSLSLNVRGRLQLDAKGAEFVQAEGSASNGTGDYEGVTGTFTFTGGRDNPRSLFGRFKLDGVLEY
jgi:hypothetical protein